jgi:hypothetical protein
MAKAQGEVYSVVLRAVPGPVPGVIRLRRFLKAALRSYGLVAGDVKQLPTDAPGCPTANAARQDGLGDGGRSV